MSTTITDRAAQVLREIDAALEMAEKATPGLDMSGSSCILDAWISSNYATSADAKNYIVGNADAKNASQQPPASGERRTPMLLESKNSETSNHENSAIPDGKPDESGSSERTTRSTTVQSGRKEWNGWMPDVSLRIRCASFSDAQKAYVSIARNQSELDSIPKTQGVLIMSFLAPKEESIASKTWLFAAGSVTQLSATCDAIATSRTLLPTSLRCLKTAIEGLLVIQGNQSFYTMAERASKAIDALCDQWQKDRIDADAAQDR